MKKYKVDWHVRLYVKQELHDLKKNKKLLAESSNLDTHSRLVFSKRLADIEAGLAKLDEEERKIADKIFNERYSQVKAEFEGIGRRTYYNVMDKAIYYVAREINLI